MLAPIRKILKHSCALSLHGRNSSHISRRLHARLNHTFLNHDLKGILSRHALKFVQSRHYCLNFGDQPSMYIVVVCGLRFAN